jgi:glycosyltransferase involved in cell wall biosynthesis
LLGGGWNVEGLFLDPPMRQDRLQTWQVPIARRRGGVPRYVFEYGAFFVWMLVWVLRRAVLRRVDVVYVNSPPDAFSLAALPAKLRGARVVLDVHDPMPELLISKNRESPVLRRLLEWQERAGIAVADRRVTVHEPLRDLLQTRSPGLDFTIVMNVPDTDGWEPLGRNPGSRTMVYAGSVAVRYGLDDVITAMAQVPEIEGLSLRIIGEGEDIDRLDRLAEDVGIADRVEFVGRVPYEQVRAAQDGAWVGVNMPKRDTLGELSFSNKIVEWVALGLPVVASRTTTLTRYFPEGTLFYAEPGDPASIAAALAEIDSLTADQIVEQTERAKRALEKIAWPVQRAALLDVVNGATAEGA